MYNFRSDDNDNDIWFYGKYENKEESENTSCDV